MTTYSDTSGRRLYRDTDRAMLGGVCAGLAEYFGLNLKVTRFLAFVAFLVAMPFSIFAYLAAVCLIPAASRRGGAETVTYGCCFGSRSRRRRRRDSRQRRRGEEEDPVAYEVRPPKPSLTEVRERYRGLDKRLAELERKVTSPRFQLEQEFRKL